MTRKKQEKTYTDADLEGGKEVTITKAPMQVGDLKIGLTLVIKPSDFKDLGITKGMTTKEANALLRAKLGLGVSA
jgi:hypothetical protein